MIAFVYDCPVWYRGWSAINLPFFSHRNPAPAFLVFPTFVRSARYLVMRATWGVTVLPVFAIQQAAATVRLLALPTSTSDLHPILTTFLSFPGDRRNPSPTLQTATTFVPPLRKLGSIGPGLPWGNFLLSTILISLALLARTVVASRTSRRGIFRYTRSLLL